MKRVGLLCAGASMVFLALAVPGGGQTPQPPSAQDAELIRLETAKWGPQGFFGSPDAMKALRPQFADDCVTIEYGADLGAGVHRRNCTDVFAPSGSPLPPMKFELSEWRTIPTGADGRILSYKVTGVSFPWKAYATSVWARRDGKWVTVFYQASTAR